MTEKNFEKLEVGCDYEDKFGFLCRCTEIKEDMAIMETTDGMFHEYVTDVHGNHRHKAANKTWFIKKIQEPIKLEGYVHLFTHSDVKNAHGVFENLEEIPDTPTGSKNVCTIDLSTLKPENFVQQLYPVLDDGE